MDRIDMTLNVTKVDPKDLLNPPQNPTSEHNVVKNTITEAIKLQKARYQASGVYNSSLKSSEVSKLLELSPAAKNLLQTAAEKLQLSARAYFKTIKVARTIADLDASPIIEQNHLAEALTYRNR